MNYPHKFEYIVVIRFGQKICALLGVLLLGCCTSSINGEFQDVKITSNVPNTRIYVNGQYYGTAPNYVSLKRTEKYYLELKAPGHYPYRKYVTGNINPIFYTGILGGGLPMIFDAVRGTHREFEPIAAVMPTSEIPVAGTSIPTNNNSNIDGNSVWSQLPGIIANAVVTTAINEYLGPDAGSTVDTTSSAGNTGSRSSVSSRREIVCPLCHGSGYSISMERVPNYDTGFKAKYRPKCKKCGGRKKVKL